MARVFISYSHSAPDQSLAQELANGLGRKHQVFIDTKIEGGSTWGDVIEGELQGADFLVPLLSAHSVASPMVVAEIATAHKLNVTNGRPGMVPVRLDDTQYKYPLTAYVGRFQEISWTGPGQTSRLTKKVLEALERKTDSLGHSPERQQMIQRVRADWIEGILRKSLHGTPAIKPALQPQPGAIEHGLDAVIQRPDEEPIPLTPGAPLSTVFDDHLGQLLILGAPGAGKTTLLLELAEELLNRAEANFKEPIPVVFNLSSWADSRLSIEKWLIQELRRRYDVPRQIATKWVLDEQLTLLLDGLDEVIGKRREACVAAINEYRDEHGFVKLVVCSRANEYQELTKKLRLPAALLILPLSRPQVLQYLSEAGASLDFDRISQTIDTDSGIWALLDTPLTLSIVAVAGQQLLSVDPAPPETLEKQREKLFSYYTDAVFKRRVKEQRYSPDQIRHWLSWLAGALARRHESLFRIEDLRYRWLDTWYERMGVLAAIAAFVGIFSALLGDIFMTAFAMAAFHLVDVGHTLVDVTRLFSPYFLAIGVILVLLRGRVRKPVDLLQVRWPGFFRFLFSTVQGVVLGGVLGFAGGFAGCMMEATSNKSGGIDPAQYTIIGAIAFGSGFAINSLARARELEVRPSPDFALYQSLRYTVTYVAVSLALGILGLMLLVGLGVPKAGDELSTTTAVVGALGFLGWVGFFFGMEKGGYFLLDHYATRVFLWRRNRMPWDYMQFLDTAAERVLLRKVGAGYMFVHRMLLEYFAHRNGANESSPAPSAGPVPIHPDK